MIYELPQVKRIMTEHGSHIEPECPVSGHEQLLWQAAVVAHDTGLRIGIGEGTYTRNGIKQPGMYSVMVGNSSTVLNWSQAWTYLNGVSAGARACR